MFKDLSWQPSVTGDLFTETTSRVTVLSFFIAHRRSFRALLPSHRIITGASAGTLSRQEWLVNKVRGGIVFFSFVSQSSSASFPRSMLLLCEHLEDICRDVRRRIAGSCLLVSAMQINTCAQYNSSPRRKVIRGRCINWHDGARRIRKDRWAFI